MGGEMGNSHQSRLPIEIQLCWVKHGKTMFDSDSRGNLTNQSYMPTCFIILWPPVSDINNEP